MVVQRPVAVTAPQPAPVHVASAPAPAEDVVAFKPPLSLIDTSPKKLGPLVIAGTVSATAGATIIATEGLDSYLAAAGSVFYDMAHTAYEHPIASIIASTCLVIGVFLGEPLLDRLVSKIPFPLIRDFLARWLPGPGSALMCWALYEAMGKIITHHTADNVPDIDVGYVQGLGTLLFVGLFATNTLLHHLRGGEDAKLETMKAKLLCLSDDFPALASVLASYFASF